MVRAAPWHLAVLPLLAGCGGDAAEVPATAPPDPAVIAALADPIMSDPDLTSQNEGTAALSASGLIDGALPPIDRSDEAVEAARQEAARLAGGTPPSPPDPIEQGLRSFREAVTAAQMAEAARADGGCLGSLRYTAAWAARLPGPLQVYPRGAVEEAAGTDAGGCALRVVHFSTPVAVAEVVGFYSARLRAASYRVRHGAEGEDHVLSGEKGAARYTIYVRKSPDGLTAADIVAL